MQAAHFAEFDHRCLPPQRSARRRIALRKYGRRSAGPISRREMGRVKLVRVRCLDALTPPRTRGEDVGSVLRGDLFGFVVCRRPSGPMTFFRRQGFGAMRHRGSGHFRHVEFQSRWLVLLLLRGIIPTDRDSSADFADGKTKASICGRVDSYVFFESASSVKSVDRFLRLCIAFIFSKAACLLTLAATS
jgi:hypothetical protein